MNKKNIKITKKHHPKKRFGQNFLIDKEVLDKIIENSKIANEEVLEIGTGFGILTKKILKLAKNLIAYEIDFNLFHKVKEDLKHFKNLKLINGDFLKQNLDFKTKKTIVANIPYNITSKILFKIFQNSTKFKKAILMVQNEFANRLIAKKNTKDYGKLTISANLFCSIEKLFIVKKESFYPQPKVDSAIVLLKFKQNIDFDKVKDFLDFIKLIFSFRRKKISNNLKIKYSITKINQTLSQIGKNSNTRAQELSFIEILNLFNIIKK